MSRRGLIAAVLLAAGGSARFGSPKQLLPFRRRTLLAHAAQTAVASPCDEVYVVLGAARDRTQPELDGLPVHVVFNPDWQAGMGTSIRCGLAAALKERRDLMGALLVLADQPLVTPVHLARMVSIFRKSRVPIVAAHYDGHPGAPVLFDHELFPELLALEESDGARHLVAAGRHEVRIFELPEAAFDVDVAADHLALRERE